MIMLHLADTLMGLGRGEAPDSSASLILYQEPGPSGRYTCADKRALQILNFSCDFEREQPSTDGGLSTD